MFLIDSLLISGLRWTLDTIRTAADAELHDDAALRDQLLDAEMRRELGEISDDEFRRIEADLLEQIRRIRDERSGGSPAFGFGDGAAGRESGGAVTVEATVVGEFHEPFDAVSEAPGRPARPEGPRRPRSRTRGRRG